MRIRAKPKRVRDNRRIALRVASLRDRAATHSHRGQYSRAERELLRALEALGPHRGKPTLDHLVLWNELGMVCKYLGQFAKARAFYHAALRYCPACLTGSERYDALACLYHNLGGVEHARRQFRRAEPYAREAVRWRLRVRPQDAVTIAADRVALAGILNGLGRFKECRGIYLSALKVYRRVYGKAHREIALVLNNLAAAYHMTGRVRRAEEMYRAALEMKRATMGRAHPDVGVTLNNLGMLLADAGRVVEARRYFERAYRLMSGKFGVRHPNARAVRKNLEGLRGR